MSTYLTLKDPTGQLWNVGTDDSGNLTQVKVAAGYVQVPVIRDYQTRLTAWEIGIDVLGVLTTTNVVMQPSLTTGIPLLSSPSNILYSLVVNAIGMLTRVKTSVETAGFVTSLAQSLLNDAAGDYWTFTLLLPFLQLAFGDLSDECQLNEIPITRETEVILTAPPNTTVIGLGTMPSLPEEFNIPIGIEERLAGQTDADWIPLVENSDPPDDVQTQLLRYYWWDGMQLNFLGSLSEEDIKLKYVANLHVPTTVDEYISVKGIANYLAAQTAFYAAGSIGFDECVQKAGTYAATYLERFIRLMTKEKQGLPVRKVGYRRRAKGYNFR
jgi:hypothetical protein